MSAPLSREPGEAGTCPLAAWAHPARANKTNAAASDLYGFIRRLEPKTRQGQRKTWREAYHDAVPARNTRRAIDQP
jgi:hypothetical protein